jgi:hypothetical protein
MKHQTNLPSPQPILQIVCNNTVMAMRPSVNWDKVGGAASFLCAVHCVMTGVALGALSAFGLEFLASKGTELAFLTVAIIAGAFAILSGVRHHHDRRIPLLFLAGLTLIVARHILFPHHHHDHPGHLHPSPLAATLLSVTGGLLLVAFHVLNSIRIHQCRTR